jgi:hypothetical protein
MDKLKAAWLVIKKQHFWVIAGMVLLVSLGSWATATSSLTGRFNTRKGALDGKFKSVRSIPQQSNHPNEQTIEQIHKLHEQLGDNVFGAWNHLYEQQRDLNRLPKIEQTPELQEKFEAEFKTHWGPLERLEKLDPEKEMSAKYRDDYLYHIHEHFPKLFKLIDCRQDVEATQGKADGKSGGGPADSAAKESARKTGIVDWPDVKKTTDRFQKWQTTPTTLELMTAQEDLWVYEALLRVIRNTNNTSGDPKQYVKPPNHKMAKIKKILDMKIGAEAARGAKGEQTASTGKAGMPMLPGLGGPKAKLAAGAPAAAESRNSPLAGRYVDDHEKPVTDPTQQPYAEFRMMPIELHVIVEQKSIPKLLAQCANSNMPIEVRSVKITAKDQASADSGDEGKGVKAIGGVGTRPKGKAGEAGPEEEDEAIDQLVPPVDVVVRGIIYIYNPPDRERQGTGKAGGAVAKAGAPAAPAPVPGKGPGPAVKPAPGAVRLPGPAVRPPLPAAKRLPGKPAGPAAKGVRP